MLSKRARLLHSLWWALAASLFTYLSPLFIFMGNAAPNPKERKCGLRWKYQWQCPSLGVLQIGAGARGPFVSGGRTGDMGARELLHSVLSAIREVGGGQAGGRQSTDLGCLVALVPVAPELPGAHFSREGWVFSGSWELPQGLSSQSSLLLMQVQVWPSSLATSREPRLAPSQMTNLTLKQVGVERKSASVATPANMQTLPPGST